jgi:chromosome segregation ATPase
LLVERGIAAQQYKVTFEDDRQVVFSNPDGIMFPSYILGWHEIEQAAIDPDIRQVYLDTIAGREQIRQLKEQADVGAKRILYLHGEASNLYAAYTSLHRQIERLEELRKGLQELKDGNLVALRDEYEAAMRHMDAVQSLRRTTQDTLGQIESRIGVLGAKVEKRAFEGSSPLSSFASDAYTRLNLVQSNLTTFAESHRQKLQELLELLDGLLPAMTPAFERFRIEYEKKISELAPEKRNLLESHRKVMEDTKALPRLCSDRDVKKGEVESVLSELITLCRQVADSLDSQTQLRRQKVEELNNQLLEFGVRIGVDPMARRSRFDDLKNRYSYGSQIYDQLSSFASGEQRHHRRLAKAYESLKSNLLTGFHVFFDSAEFGHFVDLFEDDDMRIAFKVGKPGEEFSPIDQLSAGQRCTAVFPLLLKLREGPLVVDQPEDNLDNRHIADTIAPALTKEKQSRQIVFTSHNANLVVLTDAEHIAVCEGTGSQGKVDARGFLCTSASSITKHVIAILDGGKKALGLRYKKYGVA